MQHAAFVRVVEVQPGALVADVVSGPVGRRAGRRPACASADRFYGQVVDRHFARAAGVRGGVGGDAPDRTGKL